MFGATGSEGAYAVIDDRKSSIFLEAPSFPYGGAGLVSSARDYDRFLHMLQNEGELDGKRILRPEIARLALSNILPAGVVLRDYGPVFPGEDTGFGAGGFVVIADKDGFGRSRGTFGWDGAAGTRAWVDPARKVRATMMINFIGAPGLSAAFEKALASDLAAL
jgi:CubicO group peptidase (beta-lactamase class C family)